MDPETRIPKHRSPLIVMGLGALVIAIALAGCGEDKKNPTDPGGGGGGGSSSTQFTGTMLGSVSGSLAITIQTTSLAPSYRNAHRSPAAPVPVSGVLSFSTGGSVSFTGSYDAQTDSINFTATDSTGGVYEFHGWLDNSSTLTVIFGNWGGPSGAGGWGAYQGSAASVKAYCGLFTGTHTGAITFLVREAITSDGGLNGRVVGVLWFPDIGKAYTFKGWAVEEVPTDPAERTLEIDGGVPGEYFVYFGGSLSRVSPYTFYGTGGVENEADPSQSVGGDIAGELCQ